MKVRMGKKGVIVVPKIIREKLGLKEGMVLELEVKGDELVLRARDLWAELRSREEGTKFDVDMFERELDENEEKWLERRTENA
jgi:AbrB family looped-hinge helix DNA binding protein